MTSHVLKYFCFGWRARRKVKERTRGNEVLWKEPNTERNARSEVSREKLLQIKFFSDVNALSTGKYWLTFQSIGPEHEGITILRSVGKYLAAETA